jgi:hypothetical protein
MDRDAIREPDVHDSTGLDTELSKVIQVLRLNTV